MSNSRLEKFIYAICGMEVDDLPTPLSRIETLWNCLITGGMPDFEPLSRNEKYLMAMLTDNVDGLPEPTSRGEKLLYKIATGETDLSDVPGYLSRYEELLKQLIENGGIGGTDFEYVLYTLNRPLSTLYTTAEGPVKSAILKGQTLVNLVPKKIIDHIASSDWDGYCCLVQNSKQSFDQWRTLQDLKPNTKYYISCYVETFEDANNKDYCLNNPSVESIFGDSMIINGVGRYQWLSTTKSELTDEIFIVLRSQNANARGAIKIRDIMIIEYQQGMENWDIPYFEGMQSVKLPVLTTTGKNLFDMNRPYDAITDSQATVVQDTNQITVSSAESGIYVNANFILDKDFFAGKTVTGSCLYESDEKDIGTVQITYQDGNGDHHYQWIKTPRTFTFPNSFIGDVMLSISANNTGTPQSNTVTVKNIQLELGSTATSYEPYKSNILSCNEEVTLRGIGDVRDTLDLLTGEVTERIGECILNGSENWIFNATKEQPNHWCFHNNEKLAGTKLLISDKFRQSDTDGDRESIRGGGDFIFVYISKEKVDGKVDSFKQWLSQNPIKYQYRKNEESVKTVVLSITDQDGQPTKLNTFNDITHVLIEAEDLLPTVDLEVPTKIEETLSTLPTLMNDISETQQLLNESINDQSENINEVSTAITEIRNDIL